MTREETEKLIHRLIESHPSELFHHIDALNAGIGCVLRYLNESGMAVSAGEISEYMKVSTARVAVVLRKMQEKNLIVKLSDPKDARKTMISLSENGRKAAQIKKEKFIDYFSHVVDRIGEERFIQFIKISEDIQSALNADEIADLFND